MTAPSDETDWNNWRQHRHDELASPDSWLGLAGLFWLEPGRNSVGSQVDSAVVLPEGPAALGEIVDTDGHLVWHSAGEHNVLVDGQKPENQSGIAERNMRVPLQTDAGGTPTVLGLGALRFFVIAREGRLAVRVKNRHWAKVRPFAGVESFPFASSWIIDAAWQPLNSPRLIEVPSVTGELKAVEITHRAVFQHAGKSVELLPLSVDTSAVFFVFRDRTSGHSTYGGGRFLRTAPPVDGWLQLDFNRAFNPPCAFSPFATCPLPPPENWLGFAIAAGEKRYSEP